MKTKINPTELLMLVPGLTAGLYVAAIWHQLPTRIPSHYDVLGNVDGWNDKTTLAWAGIGILVVVYLLMRFLPYLDPKRRLQTTSFQKLRFVIMLFLPAPLVGVFYLAAHPIDERVFIGPELALISLMITAIGNYMTTIKPNWLVGFRTPWTLVSETVWRKTHQLGGRLLFAGGLVGAVLALWVPMPYTIGVVISAMLIVAIIPVIYSYIYFRQEKAHRLK